MSDEKVRDRFDELARDMIDLDVSSGDQGGLVFTEMGKEPVEVTSGNWTHMCEVAAKIETLLASAMRKIATECAEIGDRTAENCKPIDDGRCDYSGEWYESIGAEAVAKNIRDYANTLPPEKIEKPSEKVPF